MYECWCPSIIGTPHRQGQLGCQDYKPPLILPEGFPTALLDTSWIDEEPKDVSD